MVLWKPLREVDKSLTDSSGAGGSPCQRIAFPLGSQTSAEEGWRGEEETLKTHKLQLLALSWRNSQSSLWQPVWVILQLGSLAAAGLSCFILCAWCVPAVVAMAHKQVWKTTALLLLARETLCLEVFPWCTWKFLVLPLWCLSSTVGILQGKQLCLAMTSDLSNTLSHHAETMTHCSFTLNLAFYAPARGIPKHCTNPLNLYLQQLDSHMSNEYKLPLKKPGFQQFSRNGKMELSVSSLLQGRGTLWSDWEIDFLSITFPCSDFSSDFVHCIRKA